MPGLLTRNSYRYFQTAMAINNSGNKKLNSDFYTVTLHTWHNFEIKQWYNKVEKKVRQFISRFGNYKFDFSTILRPS